MKFKTKSVQKNRRFSRKKWLILAIVAIIILAAASFWWLKVRNRATTDDGIDPPGTEKIDMSPATEEERAAADRHKEDLVKQQEQQDSAPTSGRTVSVTIVDASQYGQEIEVRAFAAGVYENGASCKITFSRSGQTVSRTVAAEKDSNYMRCTNVVIPRSEFPSAGDWTVNVTYTSPTASGSKQQSISII